MGPSWKELKETGVIRNLYNDIILLFAEGYDYYPSYEEFLTFAARCHSNQIELLNERMVPYSYHEPMPEQEDNPAYNLYNYILDRVDARKDDVCYLFGTLNYKKFNSFIDTFSRKQKNNQNYNSDEEAGIVECANEQEFE